MKRDDVKNATPHLIDKWKKASDNENTSQDKLSSIEFISWLKDNHPEYLNFRSTMGPKYDIDLWFDQELKQTWKR